MTACMLNNNIDIDFPNENEKVMIEAYLTPGRNFELSLMETNSLSKDLYLRLCWNAQVEITSNNDNIKLLNILNTDKKTHYTYNYGSPKYIPHSYNGTYKLKIITQLGDTVTAETKTVSSVKIAKTEITENKLNISLNKVDDEDPYYICVAEGSINDKAVTIAKNYDCSGVKEKPFTFCLIHNFFKWEKIKIKLFHITKEHYNFFNSVDKAHDANIDPFTTPQKIDSNIKNGIGIFTFYTVDSSTLK